MQVLRGETAELTEPDVLWRRRLWLAGERFACWVEIDSHWQLPLVRRRRHPVTRPSK